MDLSLFVGPILTILMYKTSGFLEPVFLLTIIPAFVVLFASVIWLPKDSK